MKALRVKRLNIKYYHIVSGNFANFAATESVRGMRDRYYGNKALLVRCGNYIYNVSSEPDIYNNLAE